MSKTNKNGKDQSSRGVKLPKMVVSAIEAQREAFRQKFNRDPNPDDPVFFDPDADQPQARDPDIMLSDIVKALRSARR
jgi:hypothetical protein